MPVYNNQQYHCFTRTANTGTATETFYANSAQLSGEDTITGYEIEYVLWAGNVAVARGANTILSFPVGTSGEWTSLSEGGALTESPTANVVVTIGTGGGTCVMKLQKVYT